MKHMEFMKLVADSASQYNGVYRACFEKGYDCGMNGPNNENCHFGIFANPEMTKAWEHGKSVAEQSEHSYNNALNI